MFLSRPKIAVLILFIVSVILLSLNNKYQVPARIKIVGTFSQPIFLNYFWDSGSGYNKYEENNVWLGRYVNFKYQPHSVEIGLISNGTGYYKTIWVNNIFVKGGDKESKYESVLQKPVDVKNSNSLKMNLKFSEIMFSFKNETVYSKIFIKIDNQIFKAILPEKEMTGIIKIKKFIPGYAANVIPLPRLKLYGLKFQGFDYNSNFEIENIKYFPNFARAELPLSKFKNLDNKIIVEEKYLANTKFHPLLFSIHVFLSFIIAWLFYELLIFIKKLNGPIWISILKKIFMENRRWIFWVIFGISFFSLLFWLCGQWPGDMNWDTFTIWAQVQNLNINNTFSFVYVLIVAGLSQFYNSPAVVAIFQITLMSGLTAWIFYFAYKNHASKKLLVFFYVLLVTSIPVGMSTIFVNTSTLFALLTAFWGFYLFRQGFYRLRDKREILQNRGIPPSTRSIILKANLK